MSIESKTVYLYNNSLKLTRCGHTVVCAVNGFLKINHNNLEIPEGFRPKNTMYILGTVNTDYSSATGQGFLCRFGIDCSTGKIINAVYTSNCSSWGKITDNTYGYVFNATWAID